MYTPLANLYTNTFWFIIKSPSLAMASLGELIVPCYISMVLSDKVRMNSSQNKWLWHTLVIDQKKLGKLLASEIYGDFNLKLPTH